MLHLVEVSTERLYYSDCYLSTFQAEVIALADEGRRVYLNRTAFYPTSGGQPYDLGVLGGQAVVEVVDEDDRVAHRLAEPLLDRRLVEGTIDWRRRYDHMQQHTGQHLLSAVFVEEFGAETLSFHMGLESSTIDLGIKALTEAQVEQVERRVNEIVAEARPVSIAFEDAAAVQGLRKASARSGLLRIVEIAGYDRSACGGTHVRSTAEIGPVQIRKLEKVHGNVRIEFVCGGRALRRSRLDFRILSELSQQAAVAIDSLPEQMSALRQRAVEAEKERLRLASELARRDGEVLYAAAALESDGLRRVRLQVPAIDDTARAKAQAFTASGRAIALVVASNPAGVLIAASPDSGVNVGAVLKEALAKAGGRGGGSATLAQGGLPNDGVASELAAVLGFTP